MTSTTNRARATTHNTLNFLFHIFDWTFQQWAPHYISITFFIMYMRIEAELTRYKKKKLTTMCRENKKQQKNYTSFSRFNNDEYN